MVFKPGKEPIREALKRINDQLAEDIEAIWNNAERWILEAQKSDKGHGVGLNHCERVEANLSKLIPDEWKGSKVNAIELFILSAVACLHDNGRINPSTSDHGITGADEIRRNWQAYKLDEKQADIVADIIWVHTDKNRLYEVRDIRHIGSEEIHVRDLAAVFCLADILECDYRRILKGAKEDHPVTRFRRQVSGWYFDKDCIYIESVPKSFADEEVFWQGLGFLRSEIAPIALQLQQAGYPFKIKADVDDSNLRREIIPIGAPALPGLGFYTEKDESIFKGRMEEIERLRGVVIGKVPVSLLYGGSGVGKTSLICAGIFPKLKRTGWQVVHCRLPFKEPVDQILRDVWRELLVGEPLPKSIIEALGYVDKQMKGAKILIALDQFENVMKVSSVTLDDLKQTIRQIMSRRFPNLHLLISYQVEFHAEVMHFLESISIFARHLPDCPLRPLSKEGAKEALETLFARMQIGIDPAPVPEGGALIDLILNDIDAQGQGFYPPYLQMVAMTLIDAAQARDQIVTLELYKELGGAAAIIGLFLLNKLKEFGNRRELAENILKALVGEGGLVRQKSFEELQREVELDALPLRDVLKSMETKRLVRPLEGDQYEVIHPYLAQLVDQQLGEEEREIKRLRERLFLKSREFASTKDFLSVTDLARLYCIRDRITPDKQEARLLMHCCLAGIGPGWYWFRNYTAEECLPFVTEALSHPYERLRKNATEMIAVLKGKEALPELKKMLEDPRSSVKEAAVWAIANVRAYEALPELKKMLLDDHWAVREATIRALGKLQAREASSEIEKLLYDYYWPVRRAAVEVLVQLGGSDKLKEWVQHPHWQIRAPAVKCLSELEGQKSLSWLRAMLHDPDWAVRTEVVRALTKLKDKASLEEIRQMASFEKDWRVKEAAIEASIVLEGEYALPMARKMLTDRDQYKRKTAVRLMALLAGKDAAPMIAKKLYDRWAIVRIAAVEALTEIDGKESLEKFFKRLKGENEEVRKALARGIGKLGSDQEAMKLAEMIASLKFGDWGSAANEALVRLDRKLYCPFELKARELMEGASSFL